MTGIIILQFRGPVDHHIWCNLVRFLHYMTLAIETEAGIALKALAKTENRPIPWYAIETKRDNLHINETTRTRCAYR